MYTESLELAYNPPFIFKNPHINTIYPTLFRKINNVNYRKVEIPTRDNDFLELDWSVKGSETLAIISHGLEGSSNRSYIQGMVRALNMAGYDALAWNYRTCGTKFNKTLRLYHNGAIDDLDDVIKYCTTNTNYKNIFLIGFSMGGNLSLLYLGKNNIIDDKIKGCIVFSVPCDLLDCSKQLETLSNKIYMMRFLKDLRKKIKMKHKQFPEKINDDNYNKIKTFIDFDNKYTAPIHGFEDAFDYYEQCSCINWLIDIKVYSLMINAIDDPFLGDKCYPVNLQTEYFKIETPKYGGHVGFYEKNSNGCYWSERRALLYFKERLKE